MQKKSYICVGTNDTIEYKCETSEMIRLRGIIKNM